MKISISGLIILLMAIAIRGVAEDKSWEYKETTHGVAVYTRAVSGSRVPMVKAIAVVAASPDRVLRQISGGGVKVDGLKERKSLGSCGQQCEYLYVRFGNWMITDRHYIIRIENETMNVDGGVRHVRTWMKTAERKYPDDGAMDVKKISGRWLMEPLEKGRETRLTYINHLDLGGSVPPFLFSLRFVEKSVDIVKAIRQAAQRPD